MTEKQKTYYVNEHVCVCMHAHVNDYISIEQTVEGNMLVH